FLVAALRDYDRAVSGINAGSLWDVHDRRHAMAPLALLAPRLGAFVGILAAARGEQPPDVWRQSPLDPSAFSNAVERYAKLALSDGSWEDRAAACGIGNTTLSQWRR